MRTLEKAGKRRALTLIAAVVIVASLVVAVETGLILYFEPYPYEEEIPNPGHGADEVWVDTTPGVPGGEMTMQDAVAAGFISEDTKCDTPGRCPQVCIGADCRNNWPPGSTGITQINQGSGITLSPNPITSTGTIGSNYSQVQRRVTGDCSSSQKMLEINSNGSVTCSTDRTCRTSGTCNQVCIGSNCRNRWPYTSTTCDAVLAGNCSCGGAELLARTQTPCWVTTNAAFGCGAAGGFGGSCCDCGS